MKPASNAARLIMEVVELVPARRLAVKIFYRHIFAKIIPILLPSISKEKEKKSRLFCSIYHFGRSVVELVESIYSLIKWPPGQNVKFLSIYSIMILKGDGKQFWRPRPMELK